MLFQNDLVKRHAEKRDYGNNTNSSFAKESRMCIDVSLTSGINSLRL